MTDGSDKTNVPEFDLEDEDRTARVVVDPNTGAIIGSSHQTVSPVPGTPPPTPAPKVGPRLPGSAPLHSDYDEVEAQETIEIAPHEYKERLDDVTDSMEWELQEAPRVEVPAPKSTSRSIIVVVGAVSVFFGLLLGSGITAAVFLMASESPSESSQLDLVTNPQSFAEQQPATPPSIPAAPPQPPSQIDPTPPIPNPDVVSPPTPAAPVAPQPLTPVDLSFGLPSELALPVNFADGSADPEGADDDMLRRIAELVQEHRSNRYEVVSYVEQPANDERLARRRARRAVELVAQHGPSRRRFEIQTAPISERGGHQSLIVLRTTPR